MTSVGIDYSASTVYLGVLEDKQVIDATSFELKDDLKSFAGLLKRNLAFNSCPYVWLEKPWVAAAINQFTGLQMMRMATIIEVAAWEVDVEPKFVGSMQWRKAVFGSAKIPDKKEAARRYAAEHFGFETKFKYEHNICEALLIARYGELQLKS